MSSHEIRQKFLKFFEARGHTAVKSSSLIPDDPSVLLTTAGMQQFKKYYTGELDPMKDFGSKNTTTSQKSFRTSDIDEVGDETHLTFFEMLGNFSFGGYFKEEAIAFAHEFITKTMKLPISYVTIFKGSEVVSKDEESKRIWQSLGVNDVREEGMDDVFWGPTGASGPCGPTTEIYCKNAQGKDVEIWNIVFNEFMSSGSRDELLKGQSMLTPLPTKGIDTGMGLERLSMISQGTKTIFETDLFVSLIALLPSEMDVRTKRIFADHARAITFLISDGVRPSNKEAGYVLRRLMRRIIVYGAQAIEPLLTTVIRDYQGVYPELNERTVLEVFRGEQEKFSRTLATGLRELEHLTAVDATSAFTLYESFGLPYEIIKEKAGARASTLTREGFDAEFKKHQEVSRAGKEAKFGGHGLYLKTGEVTVKDESELAKVTRLHTATHLMHAGLRAVLGTEVQQNGSDITVERTRFDFNFPRKVMPEELRKVEAWVNDVVAKDAVVEWKETSYEEAIKEGALGFFRAKYPPRVKVYTMYDKKTGHVYSKELCGGPHVEHTGMVGEFSITKEEASSAGVRRIRGVVKP